jgi:hypothetical protein
MNAVRLCLRARTERILYLPPKENSSANGLSSAFPIAAIFFKDGFRSPLSIPPGYVR